MERRLMGGLAALAAAGLLMAQPHEMRVIVRDDEPAPVPEPKQDRRRAPHGGRAYAPNGARETERRRKRIAKASGENPS